MQESRQAIWHAETSGAALRDVTIAQLLTEQVQTRPDAPAFSFHDGETVIRWSYSELQVKVYHLAKGLVAMGVAPGERIGVLSANCPEWLLLEYALGTIGAVLVTLNPALKSEEIGYIVRQGRLSGLFTAREYRGFALGKAAAEITADRSANPDFRFLVELGSSQYDEILVNGGRVNNKLLAVRSEAVKPGDVFQIQYTSGTTGRPKGAMLTHRSTINNAALMSRRAGFGPDDVLVSAMPLFHTAGCVCNALGMLTVGGHFAAVPGFDAGQMLDLVEREKATVINAVPTMWQRMLEDERLKSGTRDLTSLRTAFTGGTSIPPSLMRALKQTLGADPMLIMGMTECSPIITQTDPGDDFETKITTAGTPLPHTEIRVVDPESGAPVAFGEAGELLIRGYLVTTGYFDMPEQTAEAFDADGWFRSGDLAVLSEAGYLRIVGRIKDMLIRGGENVYPVEIEDFLLTHPGIAEAQVVGVPDSELGEEIFAFVVAKPDARIAPDAVQDFCRAGIARHKLPRYVECVDSLPMTANGKIRKFELRRIAAQIVENQGAA